MDRLYCNGSSLDRGTLLHLRNLVNRRNIAKNTDGRFNATVDYIETVTDCHITAAAMHFFGMSSVADQPSRNHLSIPQTAESTVKWGHLQSVIGEIVDRYVFIKDFVNIAQPGHPQQ